MLRYIKCQHESDMSGEFRRMNISREFSIKEEAQIKKKLPIVKNMQEKSTSTMDQTEVVRIGRLPKETTSIPLEISKKEQDDMKSLLRKYNHVFAWRHKQIP